MGGVLKTQDFRRSRKPNAQELPAGLRKFFEDPENHPLSTPTGLLEYFSTAIAKHMPDDEERPPVPRWIEKGETHDERPLQRARQKYPLLCMSNHGRWRMHAQCDDIIWNREVETMKIRAGRLPVRAVLAAPPRLKSAASSTATS